MKRVEQPSIATLSPRPRRSASPEFLPVHNSVGERVPLAGQLHASTVSRFGATTICINRAELPLRNSRLSSTLIARELRKPSQSVYPTCDACPTKASKNEILWISSWTRRGLEVDLSPEGGTLEKGERVPHVCETWNA